MKRPEISIDLLLQRFGREGQEIEPALSVMLETGIKFRGYLGRQEDDVRRLKNAESEVIPGDFDYGSLSGLRVEISEKLKKYRPYSIAQAARIPGITPSAISLLSIYLRKDRENRKFKHVSRGN